MARCDCPEGPLTPYIRATLNDPCFCRQCRKRIPARCEGDLEMTLTEAREAGLQRGPLYHCGRCGGRDPEGRQLLSVTPKDRPIPGPHLWCITCANSYDEICDTGQRILRDGATPVSVLRPRKSIDPREYDDYEHRVAVHFTDPDEEREDRYQRDQARRRRRDLG